MRLVWIVLAGLLFAASAFGYSGGGGVWGQKRGDYVTRNFAGTNAGIQAAIDYAGTGGNITLWPGQYLITTPLTISTSGLTITGSGDSTVVVNADATGVDIFQISGDHVTLRDFKIDGLNGTRTAGRGVETQGDYTTVERIHFVNTPDACVGSGVTAGAANAFLRVRNCIMDNPGDAGATDGYGVLLSDSDDAEITDNYITSPLYSAIFAFNDSQRALISGNRVTAGSDNGIRSSQDSEKGRYVGNVAQGFAIDGFRIDGDSSLVVGNHSIENTGGGIQTDGTNGGLWSGNVCVGNGVNGLHINNAVAATVGLVIKGNYSSSNVGAGLNVNPQTFAVTDLIVEGNMLLNNTFEGIRVAAASTASTLRYLNNYSSGNLTSDVPNLSSTSWTYSGSYLTGTDTQWLGSTGKSGTLFVRAAADTLRWGTIGSDAIAVIGQGLTGTDAGKLYVRAGNSGSTTPRIGLTRGTQIDLHFGADGSNEYMQFRNALIFGTVAGGSLAKMTSGGKVRLGDTTTPTAGLEVTTNGVFTDSLRANKGLYVGGQLVNKILRASAALNFDLSAVNCQDLTITVTGAADGDEVFVGVPNGSQVTDLTVYGWVSSADTVTIRACDQGNAGNPASGTFKVIVFK